jgi:hypothetical protein
MKCEACGAEFDENSMFCPKCGERVQTADDLSGESMDAAPDSARAAEETEETPVSLSEADEPRGPDDSGDDARRTVSDRLRETARLHHHAPDDPSTKLSNPWTEGGYSAKALRGHVLLGILVTVAFALLGGFITTKGWMPEGTGRSVVWGLLMVVPVALWVWIACAFIYRTMTIKYRLAVYRFYHQEGIFRQVKNVIEVIDISDMKLEKTLWDKLINGGVGTVIIESSDDSDPVLKLRGLAEPDRVFDSIDEARRKQRVERGLKQI